MIEAKMSSPSKLNKRRSKDERVVYRLTSSASMKFKPERAPEQVSSQTLIDRIRSLSRLIPFRGGRQSLQVQPPSLQTRRSSLDRSKQTGKGPVLDELQFLFLMDHETYLIGTRVQITALSMSLLDDYIEVDTLWSMTPKSPILHLQVDPKRRSIVLVLAGELQLLGYEPRRSKNPPKFHKSFKLVEEVKMLQYAKDALLAVFFQSRASFFIVDETNSRQFSQRKYKVEKGLTLYRAGQCVDGVLNVFFTSAKPEAEKPVFVLWCVAVEVTATGCEVGEAKMVYEVEERFRDSLRTQSITRDCFLINLGREIIMFKKGYCVDRVAINYQVDNTFLKYFPDRRLVHVSPAQIDFYNLVIDLAVNPPKLALKSTDSIVVPERKGKHVFMDVLRFQQHKMGFFYQQPAPNLNGEVKYDFALTLQWEFEQKVASLLPRVSEFKGKRDSENPQFAKFMQLIERRCDSVGKMGMSRKQAYLRIWRQSGKESVEEFKLLLDTLDYATIREEITLKLKKRSMQWVEVHKMEQGCLGMLEEVHFGVSGFSAEGFRNYLVSHLLVRKLQLFKEVRLFEREAGKLKVSDRALGDKLMINIQEYTTLLEMDVKHYLLELVGGLCRLKKDLATEIRIVLRKFKFAFRHIYSSLLEEIVAGAKEELLCLLRVIPELLPHTAPEADENALLLGVWGQLRQQQWEKAMYFDQVATVFNRELVEEFSHSLWIKRNWLTSHDVIFKNRPEIETAFANMQESIFYTLLARVFEHYKQEERLHELISHLQIFYTTFPTHLVDNVFLYRKLFLYFAQNKFMNEPFEQYLRRRDDEIFKRIFDFEKVKKGSLLRDIKPIYQSLGQGDKFNYGLLKFFSSGLSQVSDIKYLLNRINNEKWEFHSRNEEMYEVLIRGMQIKLKLGSERDIPIEEVLIYISNIPLGEDNALVRELEVLQRINGMAARFKEMRLNMSVFEMIRNRDSVLMRVIAYDLGGAKFEGKSEEEVVAFSKAVLNEVGDIRKSIYGKFEDNDLLFMYLITLLERGENVGYVRGVIAGCAAGSGFGEGQLQAVVYYCYRRATSEQPRYRDCSEYLWKLVGLLEEGNRLRVFVESELSLAGLFGGSGLEVLWPISGSKGVVGQRELEGLVALLNADGLLGLDLGKVHQLAGRMRESLGLGLPELSLYWLYEESVRCLLRKGRLQESLAQIETLFGLDQINVGNIIYPLLVYRNISCELIEQNKNLMLSLISTLFTTPARLLAVFVQLTSKSFSNEEQREFLLGKLAECTSPGGRKFNPQNILFDEVAVRYLSEKTEKHQDFYRLLQLQLAHFLKLNPQYAKSIDLPILNIILLQSPEMLVKYLQRSKGLINLRDVRCLLSYLSKYQAFDCFKVLEYGKRLFKVLYNAETSPADIDVFIGEAFAFPLSQIENLPVLTPEDDNLVKLAKGIEKFKGKLKAKVSSSALMMKKRSSSGVGVTVEQRFQRIDEYLADFGKYTATPDYPYNDSDCEIERQEKLKLRVYQQESAKGRVFNFRKFLLWLLRRTNQAIEYYLVRANENEVEEEMRKQEEILKQSFKFAPKSGKEVPEQVDRYEAVERVAVVERGQEVSAQFMSGLPYISAIPCVQSSAISVNPLQVEQFEEVVQGSTMLKEEVVGLWERVREGKGSFRGQFMRTYPGQVLEGVWTQLLSEIYLEEKLEYAVSLALIGDIHSCYPKVIAISPQFLQIYVKLDQLQKKVNLDVPIRRMLPFEGLLIRDKEPSVLFSYLKDSICLNLNENNVHTLPRVISLAFKKPQFQQQLNNEFLKSAIREFGALQANSLDENLKLQRIGAFGKKMPLGHLKSELEKIMEEVTGEKREKIVRLMAEILRGKNDGKGADSLEQRWLNPQVKALI